MVAESLRLRPPMAGTTAADDWSEAAWVAAAAEQLSALTDDEASVAALELLLPTKKPFRHRLAALDRESVTEHNWRPIWLAAEMDGATWSGTWLLRSVGDGELIDENRTPGGRLKHRLDDGADGESLYAQWDDELIYRHPSTIEAGIEDSEQPRELDALRILWQRKEGDAESVEAATIRTRDGSADTGIPAHKVRLLFSKVPADFMLVRTDDVRAAIEASPEIVLTDDTDPIKDSRLHPAGLLMQNTNAIGTLTGICPWVLKGEPTTLYNLNHL